MSRTSPGEPPDRGPQPRHWSEGLGPSGGAPGAAVLALILGSAFPPLSAAEIRLLCYLALLSSDGQYAIEGITEAQLVEALSLGDGSDPERGTGPSIATVRRSLYRLAERGLVRVQSRYARSGAQLANRYSLNLDWQPPADEK
jgi:hypothetical protein